MKFSNKLIQWYLQNKRNLPWRNTNNPYHIWLSEIILQQTRVDQGMSYYHAFVEHFPTVYDLANASEEKVLKLWQGLGYYSRARNLHYSAQYIIEELNGEFPSTYNELIKLKGVGDYTASAISSICFNEPNAVVDGNVYRVLSRYFGIKTPINSTKGIKEFKLLAQELLDKNNAGTHNQAVMEFGARMCKPQNPDCNNCPVNTSCLALSKKWIQELPVKEKKLKIRNRYFNYLVVNTSKGTTKIVKRNKGIWLGLYEFPVIESEKEIDENILVSHEIFDELFNSESINLRLFNEKMKIHKLSHQHIYAKFWIVELNNSDGFSTTIEQLKDYPVPTLIDNFLKEYHFN